MIPTTAATAKRPVEASDDNGVVQCQSRVPPYQKKPA